MRVPEKIIARRTFKRVSHSPSSRDICENGNLGGAAKITQLMAAVDAHRELLQEILKDSTPMVTDREKRRVRVATPMPDREPEVFHHTRGRQECEEEVD